jgi:serine/threonine-protein kinase
MAEVWEGRDEVLNRPVAIKMLLAHLAADPYVQERFRREAVTAARLVHPGIVAIFDAGVEVLGENGADPGALLSGWPRDERNKPETVWPDQRSTAFIVMELVPGETLRDLIGRAAPLSAQLATAIAGQVTDALAYAHAQGLVHRDIKPANVLLRDEGSGVVRVKVADFGIAKAAATAGGDLTASGTVLGTPKYLSPEQVQGKEPDPRADLYSLGVVLFEMLAGRPPFQENTDMATALAQVQQPVPALGDVVPGLPSELTDLVGALLAKDPDRRVPSALVLASALARVQRSLGAAEAPNGAGANLHTGPLPLDRAASGPGAGPAEPAGAGGTAVLGAGGTAVLGAGGTAVLGAGVTGAPTLVERAGGAGRARRAGRRERRGPGKGQVARNELPGPRRRRPGRWTGIAVAALLVAGLTVAGALVHVPGTAPGTSQPGGGGGGGGAPSDQGSFPPIAVVSVRELTQDGNVPNDNLSELPNVIGNNPSKYWASDIYKSADFGGSGGFGLVLQLDGPHVLHRLVVSTPMDGWSAEVFTAGSDSGTLGGWGQPLSRQSSISGEAVFSLGDKRAGWVLFWMIDPGATRQAVVRRLSLT